TFYVELDLCIQDSLSNRVYGRLFITGTVGTIEVRKFVDVARSNTGDHLYLVNNKEEKHYELTDTVGFPFFGELILACLKRTENAMTQEHVFKAAELCLIAQK